MKLFRLKSRKAAQKEKAALAEKSPGTQAAKAKTATKKAAKKPAAKKTAVKKAAVKKTAAKKPAAKKPAAKKAAVKKPAAKKTAVKKAAVKKAAAKKSSPPKPVKKTKVKTSTVKKAASDKPKATPKTVTKKAAPKTAAKKPATKKAAEKTTAEKKPAAKKTAAKKTTVKKAAVKKTAAKKTTRKKTVGKKGVLADRPPRKIALISAKPTKADLKAAKKAEAKAEAAPKPKEKPVEVKKPAKLPRQKDGFKIKDYVVYPTHGVGQITEIEEQEIAGSSLQLFVIHFEQEKMTLRVPLSKARTTGMRPLSDGPTVKKAMETLKGRARVKRTMWSRRAQEYEAKINSGDIISISEVVRDLFRAEGQPEQSYSERQLYEAALERLSREVAAVERIELEDAVAQVEAVLNKAAIVAAA